MAENGTNNIAPQGDSASNQQLIINAQYVKDLSFENPRAPHSLLQQKSAPEVQLGIDVKAQPLAQDVYEVTLSISATAKSGEETAFVIELTYAAVVTIRNAPQEMVPALVVIETPRIIFPFARAVIADATRDGGFPPLLIHPIDFAELVRRQQATAAAGGTATA